MSRDFDRLNEILVRNLEQNNCDTPPAMDGGWHPAAVMILLANINGDLHILYTQRTDKVTDHKGQVAFPGGAWESSDQCLLETAFRETYEEIGIKRESIRILGSMPPVHTITGYCIVPYVGLLSYPIPLTIQEEEVESVFTIPCKWLDKEENRCEKEYEDKKFNIKRNVLFYDEFEGHVLWGITAMLTVSLLALLKKDPEV